MKLPLTKTHRTTYVWETNLTRSQVLYRLEEAAPHCHTMQMGEDGRFVFRLGQMNGFYLVGSLSEEYPCQVTARFQVNLRLLPLLLVLAMGGACIWLGAAEGELLPAVAGGVLLLTPLFQQLLANSKEQVAYLTQLLQPETASGDSGG